MIKCSFWVCLWQRFWERLALELVAWAKQMAPTSDAGGSPLTHWGLGQDGRVEEGWICFLLCWDTQSPPLYMGTPGSRALGTQTEPYSIHSLGSQAFGLGVGLYHWLSWAPSCGQQTTGCLSLYNHMRQSLIINLLPCISRDLNSSVSLDNPD